MLHHLSGAIGEQICLCAWLSLLLRCTHASLMHTGDLKLLRLLWRQDSICWPNAIQGDEADLVLDVKLVLVVRLEDHF